MPVTVYTVHPLRPDNAKGLSSWGALRSVNQRFIYMDELCADGSIPPAFYHAMEQAAVKFVPAEDYLALVGDNLQVASMCALLAAVHGSYNVLRYERTEGAYVPVRICSNLVAHAAGVLSSLPQTGVKSSGQDSGKGGESRPLTPEAIANVLPDWHPANGGRPR